MQAKTSIGKPPRRERAAVMSLPMGENTFFTVFNTCDVLLEFKLVVSFLLVISV
jgi:hypothetical protein